MRLFTSFHSALLNGVDAVGPAAIHLLGQRRARAERPDAQNAPVTGKAFTEAEQESDRRKRRSVGGPLGPKLVSGPRQR
jgi:hypothetical protein